MTDPSRSVSLLIQSTGTAPYMFQKLNALLHSRGLVRFRAAVAYARWDGIGLIAPQLESFLKTGGKFQTIYGVANGVTTPDSLLYNLYLQDIYSRHTYAGAIEDAYSNATFHPKFFEFKFTDKTVAIVGSANLTGAGLSRNTEVGVEVHVPNGDPLQTRMDTIWSSMQAASEAVTLPLIRSLKDGGQLGSEIHNSETRSDKATKPRLTTGAVASPKPLFAQVLGLDQPGKKSKILSKLDPLTEQPRYLYLEILSYETGAPSSDTVGYQIQLPVATLATFFGVGTEQARDVTFNFPSDTIKVQLTHFPNQTHRVRLKPLRDVPRPAIVRFERVGPGEYDCTVLLGKRYRKALASKCTQQTRTGARRWGME